MPYTLTPEIMTRCWLEMPAKNIAIHRTLRDQLIGAGIDTLDRLAAFMAQCGHETRDTIYLKEPPWKGNNHYQMYEGRRDLGNTKQGDGAHFAGRGLIHVTGRNNYTQASRAAFAQGEVQKVDALVESPHMLEMPRLAVWAAIWYWKSYKINDMCDQLDLHISGGDVLYSEEVWKQITKGINGGYNGLDDRTRRLRRCTVALISAQTE